MATGNYVVQLNEYAQKNGLERRFEDVGSDGPDHIRTFTVRAIVNGKEYPAGVGKNKKEAKQNAAKNALRCLSEEEEHADRVRIHILLYFCGKTENALEASNAASHQTSIRNYVCWLNEHGNKNRLLIKPVESTRLGLNNVSQCCRFEVGGTMYPVGYGKTKKEAKEEAAKLAYREICGSKTTEDQSPDVKPKIRLAANFKNACRQSKEEVVNFKSKNKGSSLSEKTTTQSVLSRFTSDFDLIVPLGKGAFGHVFKAKEKLLDKYCAVKIVRCKEIHKALREVKALSDLQHCNIVRYYTCWMEDSGYQRDSTADGSSASQSTRGSSVNYLYIQMELCDTRTLRVWIDEKNTADVKTSLRDSKRREESLTIAEQIVSGVDYIHSKRLIHRDLKPANIMFGDEGKVKIGDFGLVTAENDDDAENLIERTVYKGTPCYMAPEQKSGIVYDRKVDIFALGLICFELLWNLSEERKENQIIKSMLCLKPEDRPEASKLKKDFEEFTQTLTTPKNMHCGSMTV
ncbi:hypothetical protein F2P81_020043 [Scophthalmus maximus]|uniref:Uncharacterized protein n=1 Tax=Scophthalmus maximus TaxID=52904 RepID=A0A6A4S7X6_SCOMX|nr:hypothetical protein F2P81_020043 [Scophthalmus maximus]